MSAGQTHLNKPDSKNTACGVMLVTVGQLTSNPDDVTCSQCKRTDYFKEATDKEMGTEQ